MVKQLKSRYNDINYYKRFVVGVELSKFKLNDVDNPTAGFVDTGKTDGPKPNFDRHATTPSNNSRRDLSDVDFT